MLSLSYWPNQPLTWIELTFACHAGRFHQSDDPIHVGIRKGGDVFAEIDGQVVQAAELVRRHGAPGTSRRMVSRTAASALGWSGGAVVSSRWRHGACGSAGSCQ